MSAASLARPYARAAFEIAHEQNRLAEWTSLLSTLAELAESETFQDLLNDPRCGQMKMAEMIIETLGQTLSDFQKRFIKVVAENQRLAVFSSINELFKKFCAQAKQDFPVEVISAKPLSSDQVATLQKALSKKLNAQISLSCKVEAGIRGGLIIRYEGNVIDASVTSRINQLAHDISI